MTGNSRRDFLLQAARAAGGAHAAASNPDQRVARDGDARGDNARFIRLTVADEESQRPPATTATNGDEQQYPTKIASFSKGLPHSALGEPDKAAYQSLTQALSTQKYSDAENIVIGGVRKLVNPLAGFAYDLEGGDSHTFSAAPPPAFSGAQAAAEMIELYWMALLRDVPFAQFAGNTVAEAAAAELNSLSAYRGPRDSSGRVTTANLFGGAATGSLTGPSISQYLLQDLYIGSTPRSQTYRTGAAKTDYLASYAEWLSVQSGSLPSVTEAFDPQLQYTRNGRDLAQFVHYDYLIQAFLQADIILVNQYPETVLYYNLYQLNPTSPYKVSRIQTPFGTFCGPQAQDWIARASTMALKAVFYNKWAIHRRLRPEEFGGRVYNTVSSRQTYPIHQSLLNSQALKSSIAAGGNGLLSQAYVEGAPLHPSYPCAQAAIAAACATVLKAIYDEAALISPTMQLGSDGATLVPYTDGPLSIGGEINKLAWNLSLGRCWAGVNYRSDVVAGHSIGEEAAICFLQDQVNTVSEKFTGFYFTRFDGTQVLIAPGTGAFSGFNNLTPGN